MEIKNNKGKSISPKEKTNKYSGKLPKQEPYYVKYFLPFILILTAIVFANTLANDFISNLDDQGYVIDNLLIRHLTWGNFKTIFSSFFLSNYHPLTILSYALDYAVFGLKPFYFHLENCIFHLLNVMLVYILIKRFTDKFWVAAITSLFFGIHLCTLNPLPGFQKRKDVLYSFFFLLSLNSYCKFRLITKKKSQLLWSFIWFLLSLLSKPAAVCLPLVLVLMDYYIDKKLLWNRFFLKIPFFVLAGIFGIIAVIAQKSTGALQDVTPIFNLADRFFLASYSAVYYLFKVFLPFNLSALHYFPIKSGNSLSFEYYLALAVLLLLVFGVIKLKRFKHEIIFGLLFYLITIAMVLQILPFGSWSLFLNDIHIYPTLVFFLL